MLKVAITGTKNSTNTAFTLAQVSAGITLVIWAGRILKQVNGTPGPYEFTLVGTAIILGSAPGASDMLYAYVQTDSNLSLKEIGLYGLQNGSNVAFTIDEAILDGTSLVLVKNGIALEEVSSSPTTIQYIVSGTNVTLGLAPTVTDKFRAFIATPATALLVPLVLTGAQDSINTRYSLTNYTPTIGNEPLLFMTIDGVLQARTLTAPQLGQYNLINPKVLTLGSAPAAATSFQVLLIGNTPIALNPYTFTHARLSQRLGIWLQRRLDQPECEEVVAETYREYIEMHQWSFMQIDGSLTTDPIKRDGTVTVTMGSRVISGSGTNFTKDDVGRRFRLAGYNPFYEITNVDVPGQRLEISPPYATGTLTGQKYTIIRTNYSLGPDIEYLFTISSRNPMKEVSLHSINVTDPMRASTAELPSCFAYRGKNSKGEMEVEIYPVPSAPTVIRYTGIRKDVLESPDDILRGVETVILNASAAAGCRLLMLKPDPAQPIPDTTLMQLMAAYEAKASQILERVDSLDYGRSNIAKIQSQRNIYAGIRDGTYLAEHDVGIAPWDPWEW